MRVQKPGSVAAAAAAAREGELGDAKSYAWSPAPVTIPVRPTVLLAMITLD
jgi:hypothetical protein